MKPVTQLELLLLTPENTTKAVRAAQALLSGTGRPARGSHLLPGPRKLQQICSELTQRHVSPTPR